MKRHIKKIRASKQKILKAVALLTLAASVFLFSATVYLTHDLPDIDDVKPFDTQPSLMILAHDGTLIAHYGGVEGSEIKVKDLPPYVAEAVMAVEDRRFYSHFGIDPVGLARAMMANVKARRWVQGGSTITQQLAKNLFLTPDKTLRRKFQEAIMAVWIDRKFSKDEILSAYLNRVYFGAGAYGIDAAARVYFNTSAKDLTLYQSAVLAGLLKAPSRLSPVNNPRLAEKRARIVIEAMRDAKYLTAKEAEKALKNTKIRLSTAMAGDLNRYFADWIVDQIDGYVADTAHDLVVKTTLDPKLQLMAEARQKSMMAAIAPEERVSQAALVTLAKDGAVLAMTGGVDYAESQFNRAVQAVRQPGSAFKPFVFLAALEQGYKPESLIEDAPFAAGKYRPQNYDGEYFGYVTLTVALARSLNTATIRLLQLMGLSPLIDVAARMGFSRGVKPELASGLGAGEVTLLELTNAYAMIANGGRQTFPYAVLSIEDENGNVLYRREAAPLPQAFGAREISALDRMLKYVVTAGTGTAASVVPGAAGKTGTTQNYRDAWFIGYAGDLVTGIWMGNDDNKPMRRVTGGKYPARLWGEYMNVAVSFDPPPFVGHLPNPSSAPPEEGFSDMLDRWATGFSGTLLGDDPVPPTTPVYNR